MGIFFDKPATNKYNISFPPTACSMVRNTKKKKVWSSKGRKWKVAK